MSLRSELAKSRKLDPRLRQRLLSLPESTDPDKPLFNALISAGQGLQIAGLEISHIAGDTYTARNLSLNGLNALANDDKVAYIEGAAPMPPERSGPKP